MLMSGVVKLLGVVTRDKKPTLLLTDTSSTHIVLVFIISYPIAIR